MLSTINNRILGFAIDFFVVFFSGTMLGIIVMSFNSNLYFDSAMCFMCFWYIGGIMLKDLFGQSLGKKFAGIEIISNNGKKIPKYKLILRNVTCFMWPIEFLVVSLSENRTRLTDRALGLKVVKKL